MKSNPGESDMSKLRGHTGQPVSVRSADVCNYVN